MTETVEVIETVEMTETVKFSASKKIDGSSIVPGSTHGVVVRGTTAVFEETSNGNAHATFKFTGLTPTSGPGTFHLHWEGLGQPKWNSQLDLHNYRTGNPHDFMANGVTYGQVKSLSDYINSSGELQILVWLNGATGTLLSLTLSY